MAKSHTAAIEQLLEDFNDDQMVFCLEAEALEQELFGDMSVVRNPDMIKCACSKEPSNLRLVLAFFFHVLDRVHFGW